MNPQSLVEPKKQKSTKKLSDATIRIQATAELQKLVLAWMKDSTGPRRNRSVFARKAEVANSTIQRLMNDDVFPSTDNLIKMLNVLFASDDLAAIKTKLEHHHTNLYTYIKDIPVFAKIPTKSSYSASTPESAEDKQLKIDVVRELREMISEFMRNNLDYSTIPTFARKAQVTDSTIRRIMSPGGGSIPNQDNLMRILVALTGFQNTREVVEYFEKRKSPIYIHLKRNTYFFLNTGAPGTAHSIEGITSPRLPNDDDELLAFGYIDAKGSVSFLELLKIMGESADSAVDRLIKSGLVTLSDSGVLKLASAQPIFNRSSAMNLAKVLINRFTRGESEESKIGFISDGISENGLHSLERLWKLYINEASKIIEANKGDIPIFVYNILDKMEFKKNVPSSKSECE
jgi:transcriptional regulator with XRE-family HTH domain